MWATVKKIAFTAPGSNAKNLTELSLQPRLAILQQRGDTLYTSTQVGQQAIDLLLDRGTEVCCVPELVESCQLQTSEKRWECLWDRRSHVV